VSLAVLGLGYLGDHPLKDNITARIAALAPAVPNVAGYVAVPQDDWAKSVTVITPAGDVTLGFDGVTGAITSLTMAGLAWADATHPLAQVRKDLFLCTLLLRFRLTHRMILLLPCTSAVAVRLQDIQ
jgi:hypothetical protein